MGIYRIFDEVQTALPKFIIGNVGGDYKYAEQLSNGYLREEKINDLTLLWGTKYHKTISKALAGRNDSDSRTSNDISFFIGFDVDMSNYYNFYTVLLNLCQTFIVSVKKVYKSQASPSSFVYLNKNGKKIKCNTENEFPKIQNQDKFIQSRMLKWFMVFNPDVSKKEANRMYNEFLKNEMQDKIPDSVVEALNRMWINRNDCKVDYDDKNIYVAFKPKNGNVSYATPWGFGKLSKSNYLFGRDLHISGVNELRYSLDFHNYLYEPRFKQTAKKNLENLDFIVEYLFNDDLKKLVIDVGNISYEDAAKLNN